ncbi:hypothetical protein [Streptomyces ochraceiscleroticus]|uniref:Transposase n=1 Tax=Streptomyces ochraceiscleroticus TaxID=47761 RepID=A0ABW1MWE5_9ACTN|nr:hypothetical protein [Streptomyces ochraceiscleroticus]
MKVNGSYFPGRGTIVEETYLEGKAEGKAEGRAEGEADGRVTLILRLLEGRGIAVSEEARARITGCTELDVLDRWFDRALTAQEADELFADDVEAGTETSAEAAQ